MCYSLCILQEVGASLRNFCARFSSLNHAQLRCGPLLCCLELDSHGRRLRLADETRVNQPAVASACVVKRFDARHPEELSLQVGDFLSVLDMPTPAASSKQKSPVVWWRGKTSDFLVCLFGMYAL